jgi:hypothetical protein
VEGFTHPGMSSQAGMDTTEQSSPVRPTGQSQRCSCSLHVPYVVHSPAHELLPTATSTTHNPTPGQNQNPSECPLLSVAPGLASLSPVVQSPATRSVCLPFPRTTVDSSAAPSVATTVDSSLPASCTRSQAGTPGLTGCSHGRQSQHWQKQQVASSAHALCKRDACKTTERKRACPHAKVRGLGSMRWRARRPACSACWPTTRWTWSRCVCKVLAFSTRRT